MVARWSRTGRGTFLRLKVWRILHGFAGEGRATVQLLTTSLRDRVALRSLLCGSLVDSGKEDGKRRLFHRGKAVCNAIVSPPFGSEQGVLPANVIVAVVRASHKRLSKQAHCPVPVGLERSGSFGQPQGTTCV